MMKKQILIMLAILPGIGFSQAWKPAKVSLDTLGTHALRVEKNRAFKVGEELRYVVHYGFWDAGEAVLTVKDSPYQFDGREAFHIVGTGTTTGAADAVFKVRDRYETYVDKEGLFPYRFIRNCDEGGYKIFQDYTFHPEKDAVVTHRDEKFKTPEYLQDMISGYYYARNLDFSNLKKGDILEFPTFVDEEIYPLKIKYVGKETIKLRAGKFRCMKFVPVVQEGRIFKDEDDLNVWITDDANRIPILIQSKILVGSIKMEVVDWKNLSNPLAMYD